jgi:hypothetical protein
MNKTDLHRLERKLTQLGYTQCITKETPGSYHWMRIFVKKDFNKDKDYVAYIIEYNIKGNVQNSEPKVSVKIYSNFDETQTETEITSLYDPELIEEFAENARIFGEEYIIKRRFFIYNWNVFKNWFILYFDTILVVAAAVLFCAIVILCN